METRGFHCDFAPICRLSLHHQWCMWSRLTMKYRSVEMCLIKTKAAPHRGTDLSLSSFTASSTWPPLEERFYSNNPPQDRRLKQCLLPEELRDKTCLKTQSERDFWGLSVLNIIQWRKNNTNPFLLLKKCIIRPVKVNTLHWKKY